MSCLPSVIKCSICKQTRNFGTCLGVKMSICEYVVFTSQVWRVGGCMCYGSTGLFCFTKWARYHCAWTRGCESLELGEASVRAPNHLHWHFRRFLHWLDLLLFLVVAAHLGFMNIDVRSEHDLGRYDQLFDNPALDTLFQVATGTGYFLQFCDQSSFSSCRTTCFAALLEVRDSVTLQAAAEHPTRVPDPPLAREPLHTAEAAGGDDNP